MDLQHASSTDGTILQELIEKLAYDWPVRDRLRLFKAAYAHTTPAWSVNYIYSKVQPTGAVSTFDTRVLFSCYFSLATAAFRVSRNVESSES